MLHQYFMRVKYKGVNPLPAYEREGQRQHSLTAHFAKQNTKNCGGEKARARREFIFPPNPLFFPPHPSGKVFCSAARSAAIKIQSPDFRQKKFGFCPKGTAKKKSPISGFSFWRRG